MIECCGDEFRAEPELHLFIRKPHIICHYPRKKPPQHKSTALWNHITAKSHSRSTESNANCRVIYYNFRSSPPPKKTNRPTNQNHPPIIPNHAHTQPHTISCARTQQPHPTSAQHKGDGHPIRRRWRRHTTVQVERRDHDTAEAARFDALQVSFCLAWFVFGRMCDYNKRMKVVWSRRRLRKRMMTRGRCARVIIVCRALAFRCCYFVNFFALVQALGEWEREGSQAFWGRMGNRCASLRVHTALTTILTYIFNALPLQISHTSPFRFCVDNIGGILWQMDGNKTQHIIKKSYERLLNKNWSSIWNGMPHRQYIDRMACDNI